MTCQRPHHSIQPQRHDRETGSVEQKTAREQRPLGMPAQISPFLNTGADGHTGKARQLIAECVAVGCDLRQAQEGGQVEPNFHQHRGPASVHPLSERGRSSRPIQHERDRTACRRALGNPPEPLPMGPGCEVACLQVPIPAHIAGAGGRDHLQSIIEQR